MEGLVVHLANEIGEYIKKYRKEKDMSLRSLSDITGISFSHVSKIERGEHIPSKKTIEILSKKLDLDKNELLIMSGYTPESGLEALFPFEDEKTEEERKRTVIMNKIANDFPDADLMFHDLAGMSAEDLQDVYEFIKFKVSQKDKDE